MKNVTNKLRVWHIPQVPMDAFIVEVENEREAYLVSNTLADQHLWLLENNVIPDFSNAIGVEMLGEDGEWESYYNNEELMEWEELVETYFEP